MTNVIPFDASRTARTALPVSDAGAHILFFTGVRYLRDADVPLGASGPRDRPDDPSGQRPGRRGSGTRRRA